ncbi:class I SAM-dependent methyltransferase [Xanthocytophaga flava]|uniref:class I SAM-dependent methyltransferase n=1 Tax=Xanthocytophaga flava TaxID=3048013 RepID=UPI0028D8D28F|nr:RsmD family RNA methyltransferase [Xanthocytophaga flavus]MDJ1471486.1 RsmD family RNA methyltransferase [Xanthocytophaga flavus]
MVWFSVLHITLPVPLSEKLTNFCKVIDFVQQHEFANPQELLLKKHRYPDIPVQEAALQIQARQKAKSKLPSWFAIPTICYPSLLSLEQCSSESTALFKARLLSGNTLMDLTGGMGVDTAAFSQQFEKVFYIEQNPELCEVTRYNFEQLGITNVQHISATSETWLSSFSQHVDWIYIDPARRNEAGGKVVRLQDCVPDILGLKDILFSKASHLLLKASPMLDIDVATNELKNVVKVYVVAVENEVKELLFHLMEAFNGEPEIETVNLNKSGGTISSFQFYRSLEGNSEVSFTLPQTYLYEPNVAVLKAGAFRSVASSFSINKLHSNSHLYTSESLQTDFPGRIFKIVAISKLDKKELQSFLPEGKANISVRNFPMSVEDIRKKTGIRDGGNIYLFATTDCQNRKIVLVCEKIDTIQE